MSEQGIAMLPLLGKRILVTRTREQASVLSAKLSTLGAIPIEFPTIRIVPPSNWDQLDQALKRLYKTGGEEQPGYDWLIFTSANGVNICCERLKTLGYSLPPAQDVRIAAIGPATAAALAYYGITADLVPDEYIAEGIVAALIKDAQLHGDTLAGKKILLARAAEARKVLVTALQQAGASVDEVAAYTTLPATSEDEQGHTVLTLLQQHQIDMLTFTSSSTVRNFIYWLTSCEALVGSDPTQLVTQTPRLKVACIGPITSQTARELSLHVDIEAKEFTIDGLVEAIVHAEEKS